MYRKALCALMLVAGGACFAALAEVKEDELAPWQDLIKLHPDAGDLQTARYQRQLSQTSLKIQRIENAHGTLVNFDEFSVTITKLPSSGPKTAGELFQYVRLNLNEFMDDDFARFGGNASGDAADWRAAAKAPLGSVMLFSIPANRNATGYVVQEQGAVVTSMSSPRSWVFSTVTIGHYGPGEHPVSGNREFGLREESGTFGQIYTRGVDRAVDDQQSISRVYSRVADQQTVFKGADALWNGFQRNVKAFIEKNGGEARINNPVVRRPPWDSPEVASLFGKRVAELRVDAKLRDRLAQRKAARQRVTQQEMMARPAVIKARAWSYLASAVDLACADPIEFERRYQREKLFGVEFASKDFDQHYALDLARSAGGFDGLTRAERKPLNGCQKYILSAMQQTNKPVTIAWMVDSSARFRKDNPNIVVRLANIAIGATKSIDRFFEDLGDAFSASSTSGEPSRNTERPERTRSDNEPTHGISGSTRTFNASRPDFDRGFGSTLGR